MLAVSQGYIGIASLPGEEGGGGGDRQSSHALPGGRVVQRYCVSDWRRRIGTTLDLTSSARSPLPHPFPGAEGGLQFVTASGKGGRCRQRRRRAQGLTGKANNVLAAFFPRSDRSDGVFISLSLPLSPPEDPVRRLFSPRARASKSAGEGRVCTQGADVVGAVNCRGFPAGAEVFPPGPRAAPGGRPMGNLRPPALRSAQRISKFLPCPANPAPAVPAS